MAQLANALTASDLNQMLVTLSQAGSTAQKSHAPMDALISKAAPALTVIIGSIFAALKTAREYPTQSPPTALAMSVPVLMDITGKTMPVKRIL
jgi:hypothetical protein